MSTVEIGLNAAKSFITEAELDLWNDKALKALDILTQKTGKGNDFLGWLNLPSSITDAEIARAQTVAAQLSNEAEVVVVIGIGGSYLGAKAVIEALSHSFSLLMPKRKSPLVLFAGQNIGEDYLSELLDVLQHKSVACVVISKSGTTTEPAIAFRILREHIENKYGKEGAKKRIVAVTDATHGALRTLALQEGYEIFVIPDNVGGRFSIFTPVGLFPIAIAGFDIAEFVKGAEAMEQQTIERSAENPAVQYAAIRNALYAKGKKVEVLANYHPKLHFVTEWWKQLYGESEGKEGRGVFPAGVSYTTDLHSLGQYLQEGERILFETVLSVRTSQRCLTIPKDAQDLDQLNFLAGRRLDECNKMAELGTLLAHVDGGVPNIHIEISNIDEQNLGALLYFFEKSCGISGYMLDINPFDQPGVEAYKANMFALLNKPGFEKQGEELQKSINELNL